jgi:hypothetical protein
MCGFKVSPHWEISLVNSLEQTITLLESILLSDLDPSVRIKVIQSLATLGRYYPLDTDSLRKSATGDPDPNVRGAAVTALANLHIPLPDMSNQPKVQMTFTAPVYGVTGNVEGDQIINASAPDFEALLADYKQFFNDLQQRYPTQVPDSALPAIIEAEFRDIQTKQPQRWQNFLSLQRLWNGGKKVTVKAGEHFTKENLWGKMAISFLEGVMEDVD